MPNSRNNINLHNMRPMSTSPSENQRVSRVRSEWATTIEENLPHVVSRGENIHTMNRVDNYDEYELENDYVAVLELVINKEVSLDKPEFNIESLWESFKVHCLNVFCNDRSRADKIIRLHTFSAFSIAVKNVRILVDKSGKSASWSLT